MWSVQGQNAPPFCQFWHIDPLFINRINWLVLQQLYKGVIGCESVVNQDKETFWSGSPQACLFFYKDAIFRNGHAQYPFPLTWQYSSLNAHTGHCWSGYFPIAAGKGQYIPASMIWNHLMSNSMQMGNTINDNNIRPCSPNMAPMLLSKVTTSITVFLSST